MEAISNEELERRFDEHEAGRTRMEFTLPPVVVAQAEVTVFAPGM